MRDDNCIFCKIANGEIPSATLYEDEDFSCDSGFGTGERKDTPLILPKNHFANLFEIPGRYGCQGIYSCQKDCKKNERCFGCDGVNIVQNNGVAAGQTVFHFHIHLIPRYEGDHAGVTWKPGTLTDEEREEILQKWK